MSDYAVNYTDRGLPYLDQQTLNIIFDGVYGMDLKQVNDQRFQDFLDILYRMQGHNYQYRQKAIWELAAVFADAVGPMEQSEGTSMWLALGLAIKELYGMSRSTLKQVLALVSVRK